MDNSYTDAASAVAAVQYAMVHVSESMSEPKFSLFDGNMVDANRSKSAEGMITAVRRERDGPSTFCTRSA